MRKMLFALPALLIAFHAVAAPPKSKVRIALIVESTVDDKGWCQAMHDAITAVQKKYGPALVEYSYSEKMKPVDAGSAARQYAAKGFDVIIAHGAQYKNLILEMAEEFPKTTFAFGTSAEIGPKNVFTYMPQSEETGYLNGLIAGAVTKSNVVGLVGPVDGGDSARYDRGFVLGVKATNPKAVVKVAHTGSFGDFVKAGELAQTQIQAGADVLTGSSQQALGALRAVAAVREPHLVGRAGRGAAPHPGVVAGHRRRELQLRLGHRGDPRAPGRGRAGGREPPAQLRQRRLRLRVQPDRRPRPDQGAARPGGRGEERADGRQAPAGLEEHQVLRHVRGPMQELRLEGITKRFPGVLACDRVSSRSAGARCWPWWARTAPGSRPS